MSPRKHKVAIVGAKGYQHAAEQLLVNCFAWDQLQKIENVRDFDTIIISLLGVKEEEQRSAVDWDQFSAVFDFANIMAIILNGGTIILIGDPRFHIRLRKLTEDDDESMESSQAFLDWTGIRFVWDSQRGDTVDFMNDYRHREFEDYISKLSHWSYSLNRCKLEKTILSQYFNLDYLESMKIKLSLDEDFFCHNRYKNALAFVLRYNYVNRQYPKTKVIKTSGPLIFLPEISLNQDDTLQLVLRDICGIETVAPEPEWLEECVAPGQKAVDEEIRRIEGDIQNKFESLKLAENKRDRCRRCLKLLYEREYALEPIVRDILRGFGAHVEDPSEPNKEDGWILVKVGKTTFEGVLEIKSTKSDQFSEDGRKQLLDWVDRGRTIRQKNYKGIFIGNSAVDKPFKERPWAFSDSWTKSAELSGICAIKTEDLYVIHLLNSRCELNLDDFWKQAFETNGVLDMKHYWEMLSPKESVDPTK